MLAAARAGSRTPCLRNYSVFQIVKLEKAFASRYQAPERVAAACRNTVIVAAAAAAASMKSPSHWMFVGIRQGTMRRRSANISRFSGSSNPPLLIWQGSDRLLIDFCWFHCCLKCSDRRMLGSGDAVAISLHCLVKCFVSSGCFF